MLGIYVHIPFCESKCFYCAFTSFVVCDKVKEKYFKFLKKEIESASLKYNQKVDSIFIGGGTPSCVDVCYIENIINTIKSNFEVEKDAEITIEANPNSLDYEKLLFYKKIGINRLSLGVQSLNNKQLKSIGRLHNKKQVFKVLKTAKKVGFKNINCDFLLGLEKSSFFSIKKMLNSVKKYVKHFSCYMLQVEESTKLENLVKNKYVLLPNEDKTVSVYNKISKFLSKKGFERYEISNFAKKGFESLHNSKYWSRENCLGFGLSAHSMYDNQRWANPCNFDDYFQNKESNKSNKEILTNQQIIEEIIMLGLRCKLGFSQKQVFSYGYDISKNDYFREYLKNNILLKDGDIIKINPKYYGVCNLIISNIL